MRKKLVVFIGLVLLASSSLPFPDIASIVKTGAKSNTPSSLISAFFSIPKVYAGPFQNLRMARQERSGGGGLFQRIQARSGGEGGGRAGLFRGGRGIGEGGGGRLQFQPGQPVRNALRAVAKGIGRLFGLGRRRSGGGGGGGDEGGGGEVGESGGCSSCGSGEEQGYDKATGIGSQATLHEGGAPVTPVRAPASTLTSENQTQTSGKEKRRSQLEIGRGERLHYFEDPQYAPDGPISARQVIERTIAYRKGGIEAVKILQQRDAQRQIPTSVQADE